MERAPITIHDLVVGDVRRELTDREALDPDFVIVRSDGQPVFHLVNVIDDLEMGITHVIRGEDHLSNTSKHIALFRAFGATPPAYAHIPLILNHRSIDIIVEFLNDWNPGYLIKYCISIENIRGRRVENRMILRQLELV